MSWQLQEAKDQLSKVVHAAVEEGPQVITLRGKETAVLISADEYRRLTCREKQGSLLAFFQDSPLRDIQLDLDRSKDFGRDVEL